MFAWIAFFFSALTYLHNDIFIDLADEGFLWYGVLHVLQGMVPIRDFQSYDPGRYYWCAAIMSLSGKGLMSLRLAAGAFQFVSLCAGLAAIRRIHRAAWFLLLSGLLMTIWMMISYRFFDSGLSLLALFFAVRLAEKPSARRHATAGIFAGLVAFFGINHGLYVLGGFFALIVTMSVKQNILHPLKKIFYFVSGLCIGLLPFVAMLVLVPGFAQSYQQQLSMMSWAMSSGRTITSGSIVWPWMLSWGKWDIGSIHTLSVSCMYLFVALYYLVSVPVVLFCKKIESHAQRVWIASVMIGLFYVRHMFSHANVCYLGEGITPVWVGLAALVALAPRSKIRRVAIIGSVFFVIVSLPAAGLLHPIVFKNMVPKDAMTWYQVGQDKIWLTKDDARYIEDVKEVVFAHVKSDEPILFAPLHTTFYCLLEKESPVHELYFHIAPLPQMEERTIRQLEEKGVRWALVAHVRIDGRAEQELPTSHPILWKYLLDNFEVVPTKSLKTGYFLMKRKE